LFTRGLEFCIPWVTKFSHKRAFQELRKSVSLPPTAFPRVVTFRYPLIADARRVAALRANRKEMTRNRLPEFNVSVEICSLNGTPGDAVFEIHKDARPVIDAPRRITPGKTFYASIHPDVFGMFGRKIPYRIG
jgi:hypothetical protein